MLPVELPPMTDFRPQPAETDQPRPPLARAPGFEYVELDLGRGPRQYRRETNTMPQWAGSCWYYLRYLDPANDQQFVDPSIEEFWMGSPDGKQRVGGVDLYIGGVEHAVLHLLYARFWHKILADLGYVSTLEPFQRLYNQGYILADAFTDRSGRYVPAAEVTAAPDGFAYHGEPVFRQAGKMGKSLKNSVSPDEMYESYGADTLRMYEMAMGPSTRTARGSRMTLPASTASCSACGATSLTSRTARPGSPTCPWPIPTRSTGCCTGRSAK